MSAQPRIATSRHMAGLRRLVLEVTGIKLPEAKDVMIESRLKRRMIDLGMIDIDAYLTHVFEGGGLTEELPEIIDLLTTNKTDFFREDAHFHLMMARLVPEALRRTLPGRSTPFRVWSAAASTGAEAWTVAMLLARATTQDPRLDWRVLGTDISRRVLDHARRAIYSASELAPIPRDLRDDYVMVGETEKGHAQGRIVPELRARVRFEALNLTQFPYAVDHGLDIVFLRNVLIYFEPALQTRVIQSCALHLRQGGHLIVGHSESMTVRQPDLVQIAPGVFRREAPGQ